MRHEAVRYEAVIVDPDLNARMRLRQAAAAVVEFSKIQQLAELDELHRRFETGECFDVVFISSRLPDDVVMRFIKQAKESKGGQDSAYVMVLENKDTGASSVAKNVLVGADGLLFEPYSVDYLIEITRLAAQVKKERSSQREKVALGLMVSDIAKQLDMVCYLKGSNAQLGTSMKKMQDICSALKNLEPDTRKVYFEVAVEQFIRSPLPKKYRTQAYAGVSSRIRKKVEQKLQAEVGVKTDS